MTEINFKYKFANDYNPVYINGAYGGIGPRGEIVINFFLERTPVPLLDIHSVEENGKLGKKIKTEPADHANSVIRYITTGLIMNLDTAKKIRTWLDNQISIYEEIEKKEKQGGG